MLTGITRHNRIHLIGVGGSGMIGIARILLKQGFDVSGSDLNDSDELQILKSLGLRLQNNHSPNLIKDAELIIVSSAISANNLELIYANKNKIIVIPRSEMLSSLMKPFRSIAVAGSHGKTTTTSLIANIFNEADLSPTYVIGGKILSDDQSADLGKGEYMIVEADESDGSFLSLNPEIIVITNIDNDHLAFYDSKQSKLNEGFLKFINNLPFNGYVLLNQDDPNVCLIKNNIKRKVITYGTSHPCDYQIIFHDSENFSQEFKVINKKNHLSIDLKTSLLGKHNLYNAAVSSIISIEEGIAINHISRALIKFSGVERRLEFKSITLTGRRLDIIDDYGHHPAEISATLSVIDSLYKKKEYIMFFEPHRYSRTLQLMNEFAILLSKVKNLFILEIYPASEENITGISSETLIDEINLRGGNASFVKFNEIDNIIINSNKTIRAILMQGAGNISAKTKQLIHEIQS